jgi:hypothetical protein
MDIGKELEEWEVAPGKIPLPMPEKAPAEEPAVPA